MYSFFNMLAPLKLTSAPQLLLFPKTNFRRLQSCFNFHGWQDET